MLFCALGCGTFRNPARLVAEIYRQEIMAHRVGFAVIAFAIFSAGYGPTTTSHSQRHFVVDSGLDRRSTRDCVEVWAAWQWWKDR